MKNLIALVITLAIATMTTGCASVSNLTNASCDQSMTIPAQKTVGVVGVPASVVKGAIKAVDVDAPSTLEAKDIQATMQAKKLDYLMVVTTETKTDTRAHKGAAAIRVGQFALSLVATAITRSAVNLTPPHPTRNVMITVVTTHISLYNSDGKLIRSKTTVKEMDLTEAIPAADVASETVSGCMS